MLLYYLCSIVSHPMNRQARSLWLKAAKSPFSYLKNKNQIKLLPEDAHISHILSHSVTQSVTRGRYSPRYHTASPQSQPDWHIQVHEPAAKQWTLNGNACIRSQRAFGKTGWPLRVNQAAVAAQLEKVPKDKLSIGSLTIGSLRYVGIIQDSPVWYTSIDCFTRIKPILRLKTGW